MELDIKGQHYSVGKMDLETQFHVARRLSPLIYALSAGLLARLRAGESITESDDLTALLAAAEPMVAVISAMSDADSGYIFGACLAVCQRRTGEGAAMGYQVVRPPGAKMMMFADIDLLVTLHLVKAAIQENLGNFLDALIGPRSTETPPRG